VLRDARGSRAPGRPWARLREVDPTALHDALSVARGLLCGDSELAPGRVEPWSDADAEEIVAVTFGFLAGLCDLPSEAMDELCAALAAPAKAEAPEGVAAARDKSLPVLLRPVTWSAPMLALFRSVALGRAVPRLVQAAGKAGAIALSSDHETAVGLMHVPDGRRAAFVLPARALPRPVLSETQRQRMAQALAYLLLRPRSSLNAR
jgi:hypothetical protein